MNAAVNNSETRGLPRDMTGETSIPKVSTITKSNGSMEGTESAPTPGMDRVITKERPVWRRFALPVAIALLVAGGAAWFLSDQGMRTLVIEDSRLLIATVREGVFEDFIPVRGRVTPRRTVYLDELALPRAVLPLGGGDALMLAPPHFWHCRHTSVHYH